MKIDYEEFFKVLEEHFCKKCEYYKLESEEDHLWNLATCCTIEPFDKCPISYLARAEVDWEGFDEEF